MADLPVPYRRWTDDEQVATDKPLPWKNKLEELQAWMNERTASGHSNMDLPNAVMNAIPRTTDDMYGAALPPWTKVKGDPNVIDMGKARMAIDAPDFVKGLSASDWEAQELARKVRDKEASDYINNAFRMTDQAPRQEVKTILKSKSHRADDARQALFSVRGYNKHQLALMSDDEVLDLLKKETKE